MSTTHTFFVSGTHCAACKHLIEETLVESGVVSDATVSLGDETLVVTTEEATEPEEFAQRLTEFVSSHGYAVHTARPKPVRNSTDWWYALGFTALVVGLFLLIGRSSLTSLIGGGKAGITTAFLVGLVASVSTCLAVVGGLVLSVSATYAQGERGWVPHMLFHAGRVGGFFILGGLLGVLGETIQVGIYGSTILGAIASIVMLVLGVHLLEVTKKVRGLTLPSGISNALLRTARRAGIFAPALVGAVTFFLPCGFTQSMQVVSLSSGSFLTGALTMVMFALGTLPVLALLSFGSLDLAKSRFRGIFFKTAGLVVILFALFNLHNALAVFGIITPFITL